MPPASDHDRTDGVSRKLALLKAAHEAGRFDLAMSLADSIRSNCQLDRQTPRGQEPADLPADGCVPVSQLPEPWSAWGRGWKVVLPLTLSETVGIARFGEPVEFTAEFLAGDATDLGRELRVARVDSERGTLVEVPCQVEDESRRGEARRCRVIVLADLSAHGSRDYLLFAGNPNAERPEYLSDLRVEGEDYRLDIANQHYTAKLSRQSGQLERLIYARQHGLELYAGGKGHGEPPGIDWGHDYVDAGHFQKFRMRNWPACANFEVVQGPLGVKVRRWGFPHSPVHPLFSPARVHMDVEYTFYAGVPYFLKQSRFDVLQDVTVAAMRDDEWVFSGYSFTEMLWIDRQGKLHEGAVPAANGRDLWGVGFVHGVSKDFFIALRLSHTAENYDPLPHAGVPTLHYDGHGQLWSRYPVDAETTLKAGASFSQKNAYLLGGYPAEAAELIERVRHQLMNRPAVQRGNVPRPAMARGSGTLARPGEGDDAAHLKREIWNELREIQDEQLYTANANIVDMGYVYDVRVRAGVAYVLVTMPHRGRPVHEFLVSQGGGRVSDGIRERLRKLPGVREVVVEGTWNPPWTVHRLSDAGRRTLGLSEA